MLHKNISIGRYEQWWQVVGRLGEVVGLLKLKLKNKQGEGHSKSVWCSYGLIVMVVVRIGVQRARKC